MMIEAIFTGIGIGIGILAGMLFILVLLATVLRRHESTFTETII